MWYILAIVIEFLVEINGFSRAAADDFSLAQHINAIADKYHTQIGVYAWDENCGRLLVQIHEDQRFPILSVSKLYIVADILAKHFNLNTPVAIRSEDIVAYSPVTASAVGHSLTVQQLAIAALTVSDNIASNYLLKFLGGPDEITRFARTLGDYATRLDHNEPELNHVIENENFDSTTPIQFAHGMRSLTQEKILSPIEWNLLAYWMQNNTTSTQRMRAFLPPRWISQDKTGSSGDYAHDVGYLIGPENQKIFLAIFSHKNQISHSAEHYSRDLPIAKITETIITAYNRHIAISHSCQ